MSCPCRILLCINGTSSTSLHACTGSERPQALDGWVYGLVPKIQPSQTPLGGATLLRCMRKVDVPTRLDVVIGSEGYNMPVDFWFSPQERDVPACPDPPGSFTGRLIFQHAPTGCGNFRSVWPTAPFTIPSRVITPPFKAVGALQCRTRFLSHSHQTTHRQHEPVYSYKWGAFYVYKSQA
jgi:hypothetical protein